MAKMRLDKMLGNMGIGSRKEVKLFIRWGKVLVNGNRAMSGSDHIDTEKDHIEVDGVRVGYTEYVYLMMNKPAGYVSATEDKRDPTVIDLVPDEYLHFEVFPVGRLDKDTVGLLLLTNDGKLAHDLLSPKKHVDKKYYAQIKGVVTEEDKESFKKGVILDDGYETLPAVLEIIKAEEVSEINVTIQEGKFHQVKRMFEAVGKEVIYLKRMQMGTLLLDPELQEGEVRLLTEEELENLKG